MQYSFEYDKNNGVTEDRYLLQDTKIKSHNSNGQYIWTECQKIKIYNSGGRLLQRSVLQLLL